MNSRNLTHKAAVAVAGLLLMFGLGAAQAAEGGAELMQAGTSLEDTASLQRGAKLYMNYCASCHSLKYLRYQRIAEDLGLTEDEVMNNLNFTGAKIGDHIEVAMPKEGAEKWFGKMPPDLTLIARVRGADWIYTYLHSFYLDESRPLGWNNKLFPNASMPNPLWEMQGLQHAEFGEAPTPGADRPVKALNITQPGQQAKHEFDQTVRDITAFLEYAGEPAALKRPGIGVWVIIFLAFFTFLAWLLNREYWRDVH